MSRLSKFSCNNYPVHSINVNKSKKDKTVEPLCATTPRKRPPPITDQLFKTPKCSNFASQITTNSSKLSLTVSEFFIVFVIDHFKRHGAIVMFDRCAILLRELLSTTWTNIYGDLEFMYIDLNYLVKCRCFRFSPPRDFLRNNSRKRPLNPRIGTG